MATLGTDSDFMVLPKEPGAYKLHSYIFRAISLVNKQLNNHYIICWTEL